MRAGGGRGDGAVSAVRRPVSAVDAAKRAARAGSAADEERFRTAAAGAHARRGTDSSSGAQAQRHIRVVALLIGAVLAALAFYAVSQAVLRVATHSDADDAAGAAVAGADDALSARAVTFGGDETLTELHVGRTAYRTKPGEDGRIAIVRGSADADDGDGIELFEVAGDVVGMAYAHGALYVAVNTEDGHEVWSYIDSQGATAEAVLSGEGSICAIECGGDSIEVIGEQGSREVVVQLDEG